MRISVVPARSLTADHLAAWSGIQHKNPQLASPFFRPEFTQAAAAVRADVEVAVLEDAGEFVGFFPYQRKHWGVGKPVADGLNDSQGMICAEQRVFDPQDLLRACRLWSCELDHLIASQAPWRPHHWERRPSPYIDIRGGFAAYLDQRGPETRRIHESLRKLRKLEREQGAVRLEFATADPKAFDALLRWKSAQYRRTRVADVFALDWTVRLIRRLMEQPHAELSGQLSALWTGDRLVAVHFGLRWRHVLHCWFPTYDADLARYSPGMALFLKLLQASAAAGIGQIDLGAGPSPYKESLATASTEVARVSLSRSSAIAGMRNGWRKAKVWVRSSPLRVPARVAANWTRPLRGWLSMR